MTPVILHGVVPRVKSLRSSYTGLYICQVTQVILHGVVSPEPWRPTQGPLNLNHNHFRRLCQFWAINPQHDSTSGLRVLSVVAHWWGVATAARADRVIGHDSPGPQTASLLAFEGPGVVAPPETRRRCREPQMSRNRRCRETADVEKPQMSRTRRYRETADVEKS